MTGHFGQHAERLAAYGYDVIPIDTWEGELTPNEQEKLDAIEIDLERRRELYGQGLWPRCVR